MTEAPGHRFDSIEPETGVLVRNHRRRFGAHVKGYVEEHAVTDFGPVWHAEPPRVCLADDLTELDEAETRGLAADLLAAADLLRSLS